MTRSQIKYLERLEEEIAKLDPQEIHLQFSEEQSFKLFCRLRWPATKGAPVCPYCKSNQSVIWSYTASRSQLGKLARCQKCKERPVFSPRRYTMVSGSTLSYLELITLLVVSRSPAYEGISNDEISLQFDLSQKIVDKYRLLFKSLTSLAGLRSEEPTEEEIQKVSFGIQPKSGASPIADINLVRQSLASLLSGDSLYTKRSKVFQQLRFRVFPKMVTEKQFHQTYCDLGNLSRSGLVKIGNPLNRIS